MPTPYTPRGLMARPRALLARAFAPAARIDLRPRLDRDPEPADVQDDRRDDAWTNAGGEA